VPAREFSRQFVTEKDPVIRQIAETLTADTDKQEDQVRTLLAFVRSSVVYDKVEAKGGNAKDHHRYPIETLSERLGDCEDSAYLFASLCKAAGIDVVLLRLPGHMAVGVAGDFTGQSYTCRGKKFYYVETTRSSCDIGTIPSRVLTRGWLYDLAR